jgi:hypothetical protein
MFQTKVLGKIESSMFYIYMYIFTPPPPQKNPAVHEITWKNIVEPDRSQMTIWRMRIACWMPKATNTHTQNM